MLVGIEKVKFLFDQVLQENKPDLYEEVAKKFDMKISSVRTGWFSRFEFPAKYNVIGSLITFLEEYVKNQKK